MTESVYNKNKNLFIKQTKKQTNKKGEQKLWQKQK